MEITVLVKSIMTAQRNRQSLKCKVQLTSIQNEDGRADEGCQVEATLSLCKVATNHRTQNEANTGGCIEMPYNQWALSLRHQVGKKSFRNGECVFENTCKAT